MSNQIEFRKIEKGSLFKFNGKCFLKTYNQIYPKFHDGIINAVGLEDKRLWGIKGDTLVELVKEE